MKPITAAAALAAALALGTGMALAQSGPQAGGGQAPATSPSPYAIAGGAAHVGDGSDPGYLKTQEELLTEPGYSLGTGSVEKGSKPQNSNK